MMISLSTVWLAARPPRRPPPGPTVCTSSVGGSLKQGMFCCSAKSTDVAATVEVENAAKVACNRISEFVIHSVINRTFFLRLCAQKGLRFLLK